ncbi:hypothetical protein SELMODRAFT_409675 [Selaginella moellendorffii]|uniref:Uncharacterized protein n=1 Tax=Selaginella moellendorffii TaxID=88036 RepID=D8RC30_SELML|nr:mitochondrial uncoupling protein 4 [Selaginella moellendorffii]EFJ29780.1 hypothetical protein SELMODRAFT_409675 [Selaginella moellendorffii]|eukprot:XP_002968664.1 mitochondrial uncoupling protein 4 [Selaginella moellendorffii]
MEWKSFLEGGVASIVAGSLTHPLDLIKVRMQLQVEPIPVAQVHQSLAFAGGHTASIAAAAPRTAGPIAVGIRVVQTEGARALFSGVSAAVLRQTLYSTTRLGLYDVMKKKWQEPDGSLPLPKKIGAGLVAGAIGAAVGNPADVAMVRMQADGRLPLAQRRNYAGVGDALFRMARQEGIKALWTGSGPTVQRAMIVTAAQLATYDQTKEALLRNRVTRDGFGTHVAASFSAGFVASVASNPIDVIKTRIMNMSVQAGEEAPYKGTLDCAVKTIKAEGPMALYKGFVPTVSRQGPFAVVLFVTLEQMRSLLKNV